jgi:hypothetical protein
MGQKITLKAKQIQPSQNFVKDTLRFLIMKYLEGREKKWPPIPLVRFNENKTGYVAIDGHNLLVIYDLLGRDCNVYLVESAEDKIIQKDFPNADPEHIKSRNKDLETEYESSLIKAQKVAKEGITNIVDLRLKYPHLINLSAARKYYGL